MNGRRYTGLARVYYALYRICEWAADRFREAEGFFLARAHIVASIGAARVLAARYAPNPHATQQNIPRDAEFSLGIHEGAPLFNLHPGPFEIVNEDEPR